MKGNKSSREIIQGLPPNIENAQPDVMRETADRWLKEMLELRAKRLHLSPEQAANVEAYKTQFEESIERLAGLEGLTPETYLEQYGRRIGQSTYPTPECLTPNDILEHAETGAVRPAQRDHVSSCASCRALLDASLPPEDGRRRLRDELRHLATVQPEKLPLQPQPGYAGVPLRKLPLQPQAGYAGVPLRARMAWPTRPVALASAGVFVLLALFATSVFRHASTSGPPVQKLAMLPIQNVSGVSDGDYLAYGVTERLITDLGSVAHLRVIGNNSVMQIQKTNERPAEIARKLNVDAIAEVSMVSEGGRLRMSAQVIKATTNEKLWSGNFEGDLDDALGLQGEVAQKIASGMGVTLSPGEKARLTAPTPVPSQVFLMYVEGRYRLSKRNKEDMETGLTTFQKIVEENPKFALGWASLADSYNLLALRDFVPPSAAYPKARESANKALALDPNLANAHAALALNDLYYEFNWGEAENEFRSALRLNPSYAEAHHWYGLLLSALKRHDEAIPQLKLGLELDPLSPPINTALGDGYFLARQNDQAIDQYNNTLRKFPNYPGAKRNLASAYIRTGKYDEAVRLLQQVSDNKGDLAYAYALWGRKAEARKLLRELSDPIEIAVVYAALGERDHAFDWLDKAYEDRSSLLFQLAVDPALDPLRSDSRFLTLLRRINYPNQNP